MAKKKTKGEREVDAEEPEVPQEEIDAVKKLLAEIDRAKALRKKFDTELLPKLRRYAWGTKTMEDGGGEQGTRTNLIFATMATLLPHIYAKNPEIACAPTEAVGDDEYEKIKDFASTCQVMLNNLLIEEAKIKKRQKQNIRSAMGTSVGWLKLGFQESLQGDPIIVRRANDIQDNLRRIEYLITSARGEQDTAVLNQKRAELKLQLESVKNSPELKIFKGFVIDRVQTEDMLILDESIVEFDDYVNAKKLCNRIVMTDEEYAETFGQKIAKGAVDMEDKVLDEWGNKVPVTDPQRVTRRAVYEVWDKTTNMISCVCEGVKGYCRKPQLLSPASERWYAFYALGFNIVEGRWRPLSDVELLWRLQDEYNTTRYLFAETRKEAIPNLFFRKSGSLTEEDIKAISNRKPRQTIGIEGNPTVPLAHDIFPGPTPTIRMEDYDVTIIRNDMDMLVGLSDASRANLIEAKTATEAEIMKQALQNRVEERQDAVEDLTGEMARAALEIMLQKFSPVEVKEIVGEGAVWPEVAEKDEIFRKIRVSVRAGSTGKPNILKERESWAQIMPIINETLKSVMELRMNGQFDMARSQVELLKETLRRYDEKIDVDQFIPKEDLDENGQPRALTNAMQQSQQLQEQAQKMQQELEATKQQLVAMNQKLLEAQHADNAKVADIQAKQAIATAQEQSKQTEAAAKAAEANARSAEAAAKEDRLFREKQYQIDKDAEVTKYKLDREKETAIEVEKMRCECNQNVANSKNETDKALAEKSQQHEKGMAETEAAAKGAESKASDKGAGAIAAAAKALERAAQAVADAASMDKVPEYDSEGRIIRVSSKKARSLQ